jgi:L-fuconolactonase
MNTPTPGSEAWHALLREEIIEPARPIIDPHHHLWRNGLGFDYMVDEFLADTNSGHRILKSVYIEARAFYLADGPTHLQPTGETTTIAKIAAQLAADPKQVQIAGIVAHADLRLGDRPEMLAELLRAQQQCSAGLLRGIRHSGARDPRPEDLLITGRAPAYLYGREDFRAGLRQLAEHDLSYDTWHFHHQNEDFIELAQAVPETTIVLDHFGTPLGVGIYAGRREEIYQKWREDITALAKCPNVVLKLGGLAMPDNGFGWDKRGMPPSSDEIVKAHKRYYMHALEQFGPQRCMFESNFPVDRLSVSYHVLWNAFKKMVADFSEAEKHALFYGTAERIYRLA